MGESSNNKSNKNLVEIIAKNEKAITRLMQQFDKTVENFANQFIKHRDRELKFSSRMGILLVIVVTLIVGTSSFLTYTGHIEGSAFTFLLGLLVGYILTFVREAIYPPE